MFMKEARREDEVMSVHHMIRYILAYHDEWGLAYRGKHASEDAAFNLARMCRRFAYKNGFGRRVATSNKLKTHDLQEIKATFAFEFWAKYQTLEPARLVNVDETGIFMDMPPRYILAEKGQSAAIDKSQKNSARVTATLAIKANGISYHTEVYYRY